MFDYDTKRTHLARNVKMLKKMFFRQDKSISSVQPHPLDTTFDHLIIEQDEEVTGDPHTDGVSNLPSASAAFDASDAFSVSSTGSLPPLIPPPEEDLDADTVPPEDLSSYTDSNSDSWTQATASTMAKTDPYSFQLDALPDSSAPDDAATIDVTALPHGAAIDTSPVPVTIDVPALLRVNGTQLLALDDMFVVLIAFAMMIQLPFLLSPLITLCLTSLTIPLVTTHPPMATHSMNLGDLTVSFCAVNLTALLALLLAMLCICVLLRPRLQTFLNPLHHLFLNPPSWVLLIQLLLKLQDYK